MGLKELLGFERHCQGKFEAKDVADGTCTAENQHRTQKMKVWKMIFLFNWVIFRFHVNFQRCKCSFA